MDTNDHEERGNAMAGKRSNSQPTASPAPEHGTPCAFAQVLEQRIESDKILFHQHETEQNGQIKRICETLLPGMDKKLDRLMFWIIGFLITILGTLAAMLVYVFTHWPTATMAAG